MLHAVTHWDIDSVLLPVSPVEAAIGGFSDQVIPAARERGIGIIGMKTLGAGNYIRPGSGLKSGGLDPVCTLTGCGSRDRRVLDRW